MLTQPFEKEPARRDQAENIRTQLSKLGNTPFEAVEVTVAMSDNWFVPSSLLAEMRRQGVERLISTADSLPQGRGSSGKAVCRRDFGNPFPREASDLFRECLQ